MAQWRREDIRADAAGRPAAVLHIARVSLPQTCRKSSVHVRTHARKQAVADDA